MVYAALLVVLCGDIIIIDIIGAQYNNCTSGVVDWKQDGWCNEFINNESCAFDEVNCCDCTCYNGLAYDCREDDFFRLRSFVQT